MDRLVRWSAYSAGFQVSSLTICQIVRASTNSNILVSLPIISVPGSCFYLTTYEACKSKLSKYLLKETADGKPPTLLAQAPLIVTAALGAEGEGILSHARSAVCRG